MSQVGDYNIANASGASVRSDINAVLDAIKTCNSGGSDPANPEAFMLYVDTADSNKLKIRNASNNGFTTIGSVNEASLGLIPKDGSIAMTGAFKISDGNQGAPGLSFDSDPDTGFFKVSTNSIGVTTGGTKRFTVGSYGIELRNGAQFEFRKNDNTFFTAFSASDSISENRTYTLPPAVVDGGFLQTNAAGQLSFQIVAGVPIGSVFCIAHTSIPSGYLECNGDALPNGTGTVQGITADFSALRALVGANLPDLRGEFVRGFDNGKGTDSGRSMLSSQGDQNKSHNHSASTSISDPGHFHTSFRSGNQGERQHNSNLNSSNFPSSGTGAGNKNEAYNIVANNAEANVGRTQSKTTGINAGTNVGNAGGGESRPRNVAMMYIIKF